MKNKYLNWIFTTSQSDTGILILRAIVGISFIVHGYPKIIGGVEKWTMIGKAMGSIGIDFLPVFWGLCAAVSEFFGGIALVLGFLTKIASSGLAFTMFIAVMAHLTKGDGFSKASHPIELMAVCIFLILTGAGNLSVDRLMNKKFGKK